MIDKLKEHRTYFSILEKYFREHNYKILSRDNDFGLSDIPDFILEYDSKRILVELKVSNILYETLFHRFLYWIDKYSCDEAYLAIPKGKTINKYVLAKLAEKGIGIVWLEKNKNPRFSKSKISIDKVRLSQKDELTIIKEKTADTSEKSDLSYRISVIAITISILGIFIFELMKVAFGGRIIAASWMCAFFGLGIILYVLKKLDKIAIIGLIFLVALVIISVIIEPGVPPESTQLASIHDSIVRTNDLIYTQSQNSRYIFVNCTANLNLSLNYNSTNDTIILEVVH